MTAVTPQAIAPPTCLDDVFLVAFCLIDDLYAELAPASAASGRATSAPR